MVPIPKRSLQDDFVLTLSDNEDDLTKDFEEEIPASPPSNKKRKRTSEPTATGKKTKKTKKGKTEDVDGEIEQNEGIWGAKDEDDGAMDSDFEFAIEGGEGGMEDFEGWGFDGLILTILSRGGEKRKTAEKLTC
jgi:ATP-dependent RNA helicase DDX27